MEVSEEVKQRAIEQFQSADKATKASLIQIFGKDMFPLTGMEDIQSFEDALKKVGATPDQKLLLNYEGEDKDVLASKAFLQLTIIAKALNEGWTPDWTNASQWKYYVWLDNYKSGSGFSDSLYGRSSTAAHVGSRLCYKTKELALYAGEKFRDLYNQLFTL